MSIRPLLDIIRWGAYKLHKSRPSQINRPGSVDKIGPIIDTQLNTTYYNYIYEIIL